MSAASVVLYSTSCGGTQKVKWDISRIKILLEAKRVQYEEVDLAMEPQRREAMLAGSEGLRTLPQLHVNGRYIGTAEEIQELEDWGELSYLLQGLSPEAATAAAAGLAPPEAAAEPAVAAVVEAAAEEPAAPPQDQQQQQEEQQVEEDLAAVASGLVAAAVASVLAAAAAEEAEATAAAAQAGEWVAAPAGAEAAAPPAETGAAAAAAAAVAELPAAAEAQAAAQAQQEAEARAVEDARLAAIVAAAFAPEGALPAAAAAAASPEPAAAEPWQLRSPPVPRLSPVTVAVPGPSPLTSSRNSAAAAAAVAAIQASAPDLIDRALKAAQLLDRESPLKGVDGPEEKEERRREVLTALELAAAELPSPDAAHLICSPIKLRPNPEELHRAARAAARR